MDQFEIGPRLPATKSVIKKRNLIEESMVLNLIMVENYVGSTTFIVIIIVTIRDIVTATENYESTTFIVTFASTVTVNIRVKQ